ncbi:MAG: SHOCT domain-containing protein [Burkholderiales bacterium]|nr:SHOCT domain-containing protein [Burkholderiales bacterium]
MSTVSAQRVDAIGARHGFGSEAARAMWQAVLAGGGTMAQFGHPEFGGNGQWMRHGMLMVSDFGNDALRSRVGALCEELAELHAQGDAAGLDEASMSPGAPRWPSDLGTPETSGAQDGMRYGFFPQHRRLVIEDEQGMQVYDTGDHTIQGVSQQRGNTVRGLRFASQHGVIDLAQLRVVPVGDVPEPATADRRVPAAAQSPTPPPVAPGNAMEALALLKTLGELARDGVLTPQEFADKKAELLRRL